MGIVGSAMATPSRMTPTSSASTSSPTNIMSVARKLRDVAASENGSALVQRGMQSQLVAMLRNPNDMVAQSAMEALFFLSNNPENRKALAQTKGLSDAVNASAKHESHGMRSVAEATLGNLSDHIEAPVMAERTNRRRSMARGDLKAMKSANLSQVAQVEAKTYAVNVSDGQLLEHPFLDKRIVRHKGVISVQVDTDKSVITLCAAKTAEEIRQLLESVDILVLPEDIGDAPEYTEDKENQSSYATPETTNKVKKGSLSNVNKPNSYQARIDAKFKKTKAKETNSYLGSIWGSVRSITGL